MAITTPETRSEKNEDGNGILNTYASWTSWDERAARGAGLGSHPSLLGFESIYDDWEIKEGSDLSRATVMPWSTNPQGGTMLYLNYKVRSSHVETRYGLRIPKACFWSIRN